jgi:hypothetical protein
MSKTLIDIDEDLLVQAQRIPRHRDKASDGQQRPAGIVRREAATQFVTHARRGTFVITSEVGTGPC